MFVSLMFICNEIAVDRLFVSDVYDFASLLVIFSIDNIDVNLGSIMLVK